MKIVKGKSKKSNLVFFFDKLKVIFSFFSSLSTKIDLWYGNRWHEVRYVSEKAQNRRFIGFIFIVLAIFIYNFTFSADVNYVRTLVTIPVIGKLFYWQYNNGFIINLFCLILIFWILRKLKIKFFGYRKSSLIYGKRLGKSLFGVIRSNHLYNSEIVDGVERITSSILFRYSYSDDEIRILSYSNGANYTAKGQDLANLLSSAIGYNCLSVDNTDPSYTCYIFRRSNVERVHVVEDDVSNIYGENTEIFLDSETVWRFDKAPHALIAGGTGGGKSTYINYLIIELLKKKAEIYLCDPKRSDLAAFVDYLPKGRVGATPGQIAKIMREAVLLMDKRYEENKGIFQGNYIDYGLRPRFIFFDEIGAFMEEDKKIAKEVEAYMKQLVFKGRQMGVFMVLSTQKPNADSIPTAVRDQIGLRVTLGQMSSSGLRMALGDFDEQLPKAVMSQGRGYYYVDGLGWETPRPYTAPYLNAKEINYISVLRDFVAYAES